MPRRTFSALNFVRVARGYCMRFVSARNVLLPGLRAALGQLSRRHPERIACGQAIGERDA